MFTLTISCFTTSKLPWFINLIFQVLMQYCSLQHWTLLLSTVTSTTGCCFHFGSISSLFLELFLHWSPVTYWEATDLGSSSFSVISFCILILFMGFSVQAYWSGLSFSSPVDYVLHHDLLVLLGPSRHGLYLHWVRQGCGPCDQFGSFSVIVILILSALWMIRGFWKFPVGRQWLWGKQGLVLMVRATLSKSLIQFSVDGWGCVPSLLFGWGQTVTHASIRNSWTLTGKFGLVFCGDPTHFSRLLLCTRFCLCPPVVCFPSPVEVL